MSFVSIACNISFTYTDGRDIQGREELERKTPQTGREVKSANEREMQLCAFALGALIFYAAARFVIHLQGC